MNTKILFICSIVVLVCLTGCMSYPNTYIQDSNITTSYAPTPVASPVGSPVVLTGGYYSGGFPTFVAPYGGGWGGGWGGWGGGWGGWGGGWGRGCW